MNNPRTVPLLTTVLFIAILLSFSIYFGITALIASPDSYSEAPYREDAPLPDSLTAFDRGFYLDATLNSWLTVNDYRIFGQVADRSVLVGKDEFLFPTENETGYPYLADHAGDALYDADTLDRIAKSLAKRSIAYENQGATYLLAVIPSVQTIYSDKLPWGLGRNSGKTRLTQLGEYLSAHSEVSFLDLTECLQIARLEGQVYNNTEDSLSALGAYAVYRAVYDALPEALTERTKPMTGVSIYTRYTSGKALARTSGVDRLIKNRTLSLSNDTIFKYTVLERVAGMEITYTKTNFKDEIPSRPAILLEFSEDWDKIQLMPYFSNTFGVAAYKTNAAYSSMAVDYLKPSLVVQFIHESELDRLLDTKTLLTYNDGLRPGDDPFTAMTPIVLGTAQNASDSVCIIGRCEEGSTVRLSGEGVRAASVVTHDERFILEAVLEDGRTSATITLVASTEGKQSSTPEVLTVALDGAQRDATVRVGENSMLFSAHSANAAYIGTYTRKQLRRVTESFVAESREAEALTGKPTQTVYAYIPDKLDIYGELLDDYALTYTQIPRVTQLSEALRFYQRVDTVDLSSALRTERSSGLLYRRTDSGLTPLGAYTAYCALLELLSETDPRLIPRQRDVFVAQTEIRPGGDLIEALGLNAASITESVTKLIPRRQNTVCTALDGSPDPTEEEGMIYTHHDDTLPVVLIVRDRYGTPIVPYLAEHFSYTYVLPEGELTPDDSLLSTLKPDLILHLTSEYHLPLN